MSAIERLVGIPYVIDGRGWEGADCWGVVYLYFQAVHGIEVERYDAAGQTTAHDRAALSALIHREIAPPWHSVDEPRPGDLVLIRHGRQIAHVGIWLDGGRVLHSPGPGPSLIERASSPHMKRRIAGFLRHEDLL